MRSIEVNISGMDCAECAAHVQTALNDLPQIHSAEVLLGAEKAIISFETEPPQRSNKPFQMQGMKPYLKKKLMMVKRIQT